MIAGPLLGTRPGRVTGQGEVLAALLAEHGTDVVTASAVVNPFGRVLDTLAVLARRRGDLDAVLILVFSGRSFAVAEATAALASVMRLPTLLWLHGGNLPAFALRHRRRVRRLLASAERVVAPSAFLASELHSLRPDIECIPNVLPLAQGYPTKVRTTVAPRLLWMRSFDEEYRPELAVDVLAELRSRGVDASLTMAGQTGEREPAVRTRATRLGVADHVAFPGFLDAAAKRAAFATHDIFLATNRVDNAPVALLEAAASGLVIVAMSVGGIPHLFRDGHDAVLVEDGDVAAMSDAVVALVRGELPAGAISANATALAEGSRAGVVLDRWVRVLDEVSATRVGRRA